MRIALFAGLFALVAGCYSPTLAPVGYYCHPEDVPACPDGSQCRPVGGDFRCVAGGGVMDGGMTASLIPKTSMYTGTRIDPILDTLQDCPDTGLEPNDGDQSPISPPVPTPDATIPRVTRMSICPKGNRPETGRHDVDYFKIDTNPFEKTSLTVVAEVFYDVAYGDIDVGVFDETGRMLAADGSAITNGCTAASIGKGVYYVVVAGANNMDVNRYDLRIRTFSSSRTCPTPGATDGGS